MTVKDLFYAKLSLKSFASKAFTKISSGNKFRIVENNGFYKNSRAEKGTNN